MVLYRRRFQDTEWTPWNSQLDPTLVYTYEGEPGVGFRSRWTGEKAGKGTLEITSAEPGRGIVYVMKFEGFPPSSWSPRGYCAFPRAIRLKA